MINFAIQARLTAGLGKLEKVAKERDLYVHPAVEALLQQIEDKALPIIERLNKATAELSLAADEEATIAIFFALQAQRVPAQARIVQTLGENMARLYFEAEALGPAFDEAKTSGMLSADVTRDDIRRALKGVKAEMRREPAALLALDTAREIAPPFLIKRPILLRSASELFITSDYPVLPMPIADAPAWAAGGFLMSTVFCPIGRHAALLWIAADRPRSRSETGVQIPVKQLAASQVRQAGKLTVQTAERFVFSSEKNAKLREMFDATNRPERIRFDNFP